MLLSLRFAQTVSQEIVERTQMKSPCELIPHVAIQITFVKTACDI